MRMFNDSRKYVFVVALLVLACLCMYFNYALSEHEKTILREMSLEKQQDVKLIGSIIDRLVETDIELGTTRGYEDILINAVQYIEANYNYTYAQVFNEGLEPLTELHTGVGGGEKHSPFFNEEFVEAVLKHPFGDFSYEYNTPEAGGRMVNMTFRWVPSRRYDGDSSKFLIAVGISKYTIQESLSPNVTYGAVAIIIFASICIIGTAIVLVRLGNIYDNRKGQKWRSAIKDGETNA